MWAKPIDCTGYEICILGDGHFRDAFLVPVFVTVLTKERSLVALYWTTATATRILNRTWVSFYVTRHSQKDMKSCRGVWIILYRSTKLTGFVLVDQPFCVRSLITEVVHRSLERTKAGRQMTMVAMLS
jgi:hypothetical protein